MGAFRTYRARGQCKYAYVTVTYGVVSYASTSENIFQTYGDPRALGSGGSEGTAGGSGALKEYRAVVTQARTSHPCRHGTAGLDLRGPGIVDASIPRRLIGKTGAFGALNRGSNPRAGAVYGLKVRNVFYRYHLFAGHRTGGPALDLPIQARTAQDVDAQAAVVVVAGVLADRPRVVALESGTPELGGL